eukprot:m.49189 g.49189  ORF g.49189 m.49189 type:complete len:226 (+) comp15018_c0_seq3:178-855(+)
MSGLRVLGHYVSQPTRAVLWTLRMKNVPFEFEKVDPVAGETRNEEFYKISPSGLIPVISDGGFYLSESHAILVYLSEKHGWTDLYPTNPQERARVNEYLHWHHSNMRRCSSRLFLPTLQATLGARPFPDDARAASEKAVHKVLSVFDQRFLSRSEFLAGAHVTLADLSAYCELDQIKYCQLLDLAPYTRLQRWMDTLAALPHHDDVRKSLFRLAKLVQEKPKASL